MAAPTRVCDRTEHEEPRRKQPTTDMRSVEAAMKIPETEKLDPTRAYARVDRELPKCARQEAEIADPNLPKLRREIELASASMSTTLAVADSLAVLPRTLKALPRLIISKTEARPPTRTWRPRTESAEPSCRVAITEQPE
jgi:hypothetical protein